MSPRIALTPGDPRGIGPEVMEHAARAFLDEEPGADLLLLGPGGGEPGAPRPDRLAFEPVGPASSRLRPRGGPGADADVRAGRAAADAVERAVELALEGQVAGIVTGPAHKPSLRAAGWTAPGHTERLRELTGVDRVGMLMAAEETRLGGALRILLATTHLPLREVPGRLSRGLLVEQTALLDRALRAGWSMERPRLALCALNPHASDGGLFGDEEARILAPAVEVLAADGVEVTGPLPADTVFHRALEGEFDAVVAPYHDVGMAAFKTASFGRGVNVTLGLPFVRTSPDHGTAFDIAGTGEADATSALEALRLAWKLVSSPL